eukprot:1381979-Pleurochrysis_carterae.AAC.1
MKMTVQRRCFLYIIRTINGPALFELQAFNNLDTLQNRRTLPIITTEDDSWCQGRPSCRMLDWPQLVDRATRSVTSYLTL